MKNDKKYNALLIKYENTMESLEIIKTKLEVYEENKEFSKGNMFNDFEQSDLNERLSDLEKEKRNLENENQILKISNKNELNTKVLEMESEIFELNKDREKLKQQNDLKDQKIKLLEDEIDGLRN